MKKKIWFIVLLICYLSLAPLYMILTPHISNVSAKNIEALPAPINLIPATSLALIAVTALGKLLILLGVIGLFFFWKPARYIFFIGSFVIISSVFFHPPHFKTSLDVAFFVIWIVLTSGIILLCFFGPISGYFERKLTSDIK